MRNIIISFIAVGGAVFYDFFVADLSAAVAIALALTGLLVAATKGDVKEIRRLIKNKRKPESGRRRRLDAALMFATTAGRGHFGGIAKVLLDNGAEPNQVAENG